MAPSVKIWSACTTYTRPLAVFDIKPELFAVSDRECFNFTDKNITLFQNFNVRFQFMLMRKRES